MKTFQAVTWTLREATEGDDAFLRRLYADTHRADFAGVGLPVETQEMLVEQQFTAREFSYRAAYPGASSSIVLVDGEPAGRLLVATTGDELCLVDIALLADFHGDGIGTQLLTDLVARADREGRPVTLHVDKASRARHLYQRLGFRPHAEDPFRVAMRREPLTRSTS